MITDDDWSRGFALRVFMVWMRLQPSVAARKLKISASSLYGTLNYRRPVLDAEVKKLCRAKKVDPQHFTALVEKVRGDTELLRLKAAALGGGDDAEEARRHLRMEFLLLVSSAQCFAKQPS